MPQLSWNLAQGAGGEATLTIHATPAPSGRQDLDRAVGEPRLPRVALGIGPAEDRRDDRPRRSAGLDWALALFGELEYQIDGIPYHLTTTFLEPGVDKP